VRSGELNTATLGNLGHTLTYNLDKKGNRTSVVDNNITSTYTPNTIDQYTIGAGLSVVNGPEHEIQTYNGVTYDYFFDERLTSATSGTTTYSMVYDALGRCITRSLTGGPTTNYIYDGEKPILEYDANGTEVGVNLYGKGVDELLERVAIGSDGLWYVYFPQQNHEGSVTMLTDGSGTAIERYRYDAFGAPTFYTGTWGTRSNTIYDNRFLFTGREYATTYRSTYTNAAFNFYEYRARAYNAKLGRFMSEDPKLFDAGDYNLFRYCHNDPIDFTDPMGMDPHALSGHVTPELLDKTEPPAPQAVWERQMLFSRSCGAVAYAAMNTLQLHSSVMNYREAAGLQTSGIPSSASSISRNQSIEPSPSSMPTKANVTVTYQQMFVIGRVPVVGVVRVSRSSDGSTTMTTGQIGVGFGGAAGTFPVPRSSISVTGNITKGKSSGLGLAATGAYPLPLRPGFGGVGSTTISFGGIRTSGGAGYVTGPGASVAITYDWVISGH
jgi:RHS repeat-associated protein